VVILWSTKILVVSQHKIKYLSNMSHFASIDSVAPRNALNFFAVTGKLKTLKRTGWIDNG
jgi:hypothetical protein